MQTLVKELNAEVENQKNRERKVRVLGATATRVKGLTWLFTTQIAETLAELRIQHEQALQALKEQSRTADDTKVRWASWRLCYFADFNAPPPLPIACTQQDDRRTQGRDGGLEGTGTGTGTAAQVSATGGGRARGPAPKGHPGRGC